MPQPTDRLGLQLLSLMRILKECAKTALDQEGLSLVQIQALWFIGSREKPLSHELAEFLAIAPPSATSLVDAMVKAKLVMRRPDKNDRRAARLELSANGKKELKRYKAKIVEVNEAAVSGLTEAEKKALSTVLNKIITKDHQS